MKAFEVANENGYSDFMCTCLQTQLMMELTKSSLKGIYTNENTYAKKWGVKEWGGYLLEGGIFSVAYGNSS